jgi:hypothetical protein
LCIEPGGFIRLFVDLGEPMERLLAELMHKRSVSPHAQVVASAFSHAPAGAPPGTLTTPRPNPQANAALRFTDKEIAATLVVSMPTVRRSIVEAAQEHNLL